MSHYITCHNCGQPECMDSDTGVHRLDDGTICPDPRDKLIADLRAEVSRLQKDLDRAQKKPTKSYLTCGCYGGQPGYYGCWKCGSNQ